MSKELLKIDITEVELRNDKGDLVFKTTLPLHYISNAEGLTIESLLALRFKFENSAEYELIKKNDVTL